MKNLSRSIAGALLAAMTALPALAATYESEQGVCPFKEKSWFDAGTMDCVTLVAREAGAAEAYRLPVLRLKRTDGASKAAPVVFVNGGPGGRGVTEVGDWLAHPLRKRHDIILYDSRGTGAATPRPCPELGAQLAALVGRDLDARAALAERRALVQRCIGSVPPKRRGGFGADVLADDLAAVGRMFGYPRLNVYAASYGTRVAAAYARRHPQALERMLLDSVVPQAPYYGEIAGNFEAALDRAFQQCERDAACNARYPGFRRDYHAVSAALAATPLRLPARQAGGADLHIDAHDFALLVQQLMYGKDFLPGLPLLFSELAGGNSGAVRLLYEFTVGMRMRSINFGVYYLALLNDEPPALAAAASGGPRPGELLFFGHDMAVLEGLGAARGAAPAAAGDSGFAGPVLVVAGALDPVTSPAYGRRLVAQGGGAAAGVGYREIAAAGHTPTLADPCAGPAVAAFFGGGQFETAPGCQGAAMPAYWMGSLHRTAWPRALIESVFVAQSFLPLAGLLAVVVLYCGFIGWGAVRLLRRRKGKAALPPERDERRLLLGARVGIGSGALALLGICLVMGMAITGPAPVLLLFGLAVGTPVVASIAGLILLSAACSIYVLAALVRRRRRGAVQGGVVRPRWALLGVGINFCLFGLLLQWTAAGAGAG